MPHNEIILVVTALLCAALVFAAWKLDKERLYSLISIFLILISITGGKIVEFFGFETNTGNIYASVSLATYFLIERYGRREGLRSIWIGIISVVSFTVLARLTVLTIGTDATEGMSTALAQALAPAPRLALASLIAFACSQLLNVYLFIYLKQRFGEGWIWVRANIANGAAQILDSALFFTIAFWGIVAPGNISEIMITGLIIKVVFMLLAAPMLSFNRFEEESDADGHFTSLTLKR